MKICAVLVIAPFLAFMGGTNETDPFINVSSGLRNAYTEHFDQKVWKIQNVALNHESKGDMLKRALAEPDDRVVSDKDGELWVSTFMNFVGDTTTLHNLYVETGWYAKELQLIPVQFPLKRLPEIASAPGVMYIMSATIGIEVDRGARLDMDAIGHLSDSLIMVPATDYWLFKTRFDRENGQSTCRVDSSRAGKTALDSQSVLQFAAREFSLDRSELVTWLWIDGTTSLIGVLFNDSLPAGQYTFYPQWEFVKNAFAEHSQPSDTLLTYCNVFRIGSKKQSNCAILLKAK